jgi:hypothetical protein
MIPHLPYMSGNQAGGNARRIMAQGGSSRNGNMKRANTIFITVDGNNGKLRFKRLLMQPFFLIKKETSLAKISFYYTLSPQFHLSKGMLASLLQKSCIHGTL